MAFGDDLMPSVKLYLSPDLPKIILKEKIYFKNDIIYPKDFQKIAHLYKFTSGQSELCLDQQFCSLMFAVWGGGFI